MDGAHHGVQRQHHERQQHVGHGDQRAGHVVDHGQALLVADQAQRHQQVVDDALGLQQHDPRCRAHQQRGPERQQHAHQQQRGAPRRRMGYEVGERIAEQQAQYRDRHTDQEGACEQLQVDALLLRLAHDAAVRSAVAVQRVQIVAQCPPLSGALHRPPCARLAPRRIGRHHCRAPGVGLGVLQPPRAARDDAAQSGLDAVHPGGDLANRALLARLHQFAGGGREHLFVRQLAAVRLLAAVPGVQQGERRRQRVGDYRVVDAAHQHGGQRRQKRHADESGQRQHQGGGAPAGAAAPRRDQRASHAPKRSFTWSP